MSDLLFLLFVTVLKKMAKNAKKVDIVKIEIHCTQKIRLGYLTIPSHRLRKLKEIRRYD